mgnify:CR=1 FL=1
MVLKVVTTSHRIISSGHDDLPYSDVKLVLHRAERLWLCPKYRSDTRLLDKFAVLEAEQILLKLRKLTFIFLFSTDYTNSRSRRRITTLSTNPMPISIVSSDEPPELTNGSVSPVTGRMLRFIPIDTIVWKKIIPPTP